MNYKTFFQFGSWALLVTGCIHLMSFFNQPEPANDTERELFNLLKNYRLSIGRSMEELINFFSLSMSLLCFFAAFLNSMLARYFDNEALAKKVVVFNAIFWTVYLVPLYLLTFLPPQVCFTVAWLGFAAAAVMLLRRK